jgi:hypothetical protein
MHRRQALQLLGVAAAAGAQAAPSDRDKLIGAYKLRSYKRRSQDGTEADVLGPEPIGRITYDRAGRMSAFLMRPERARLLSTAEMANATPEQLREVIRTLNGFTAYMGTFDVDEKTNTVTHHVKAIANPASVGTDFPRKYRFEGNLLHLRAEGNVTLDLVWEREPDA